MQLISIDIIAFWSREKAAHFCHCLCVIMIV
nr:MAG TPA: hypothetical protein [Caudoviricetes sp.]